MISNLQVTEETFESLETLGSANSGLQWELVFTLPAWLRTWWQHFGDGSTLRLTAVRRDSGLIGISPLQVRGDTACFVGSPNVCDYQDFVTSPGNERDFFKAVLDDLTKQGVKTLLLESLRPDSATINHLVPLAKERNYAIQSSRQEVSLDTELPVTWEAYLQSLDGKQRHEIRRKQRNLQQMGQATYRVIGDKEEMPSAITEFLKLFPESRSDKADFMTESMQSYFKDLTNSMADSEVVRFGVLEFERKIVAMIMYFDYREGIYLYNSAYLPEYRSLSVGLISKTSCIEDSIGRGKKKFDFLKGHEPYKYHLGGKEIPLYDYRISLI